MMSSRWRRRGGWSAPAWARPTTGCRGEPFLFFSTTHTCFNGVEYVCIFASPPQLKWIVFQEIKHPLIIYALSSCFLTSGSEKSCEDCKHSHRFGRQTFQSRRQFENCGGTVLVLKVLESSEKAMLRLETWCWLWQWTLWQGSSDGIWQHNSCPSILQRVDHGCAWQSCSKKVNELTPSYCKWPRRDAPLYQSCSFV